MTKRQPQLKAAWTVPQVEATALTRPTTPCKTVGQERPGVGFVAVRAVGRARNPEPVYFG